MSLFKCLWGRCTAGFHTEADLDQHFAEHCEPGPEGSSPEALPDQCQWSGCTFRFVAGTQNQGRWMHLRQRHTDFRPVACDQCDKSFLASNVLDHHVKTIHVERQVSVFGFCFIFLKVNDVYKIKTNSELFLRSFMSHSPLFQNDNDLLPLQDLALCPFSDCPFTSSELHYLYQHCLRDHDLLDGKGRLVEAVLAVSRQNTYIRRASNRIFCYSGALCSLSLRI